MDSSDSAYLDDGAGGYIPPLPTPTPQGRKYGEHSRSDRSNDRARRNMLSSKFSHSGSLLDASHRVEHVLPVGESVEKSGARRGSSSGPPNIQMMRPGQDTPKTSTSFRVRTRNRPGEQRYEREKKSGERKKQREEMFREIGGSMARNERLETELSETQRQFEGMKEQCKKMDGLAIHNRRLETELSKTQRQLEEMDGLITDNKWLKTELSNTRREHEEMKDRLTERNEWLETELSDTRKRLEETAGLAARNERLEIELSETRRQLEDMEEQFTKMDRLAMRNKRLEAELLETRRQLEGVKEQFEVDGLATRNKRLERELSEARKQLITKAELLWEMSYDLRDQQAEIEKLKETLMNCVSIDDSNKAFQLRDKTILEKKLKEDIEELKKDKKKRDRMIRDLEEKIEWLEKELHFKNLI